MFGNQNVALRFRLIQLLLQLDQRFAGSVYSPAGLLIFHLLPKALGGCLIAHRTFNGGTGQRIVALIHRAIS